MKIKVLAIVIFIILLLTPFCVDTDRFYFWILYVFELILYFGSILIVALYQKIKKQDDLTSEVSKIYEDTSISSLSSDADIHETDNTDDKILSETKIRNCSELPINETANSLSKEELISILRQKIIGNIKKSPKSRYVLYLGDAAKSFPDLTGWDFADFEIDLNTMQLSVTVSTYPNQFGYSRERGWLLTIEEFAKKAKMLNMPSELQCMKTEDDWLALFDEELKTAISTAQKILQKKEQEKWEKDRDYYAIKIPVNFISQNPKMIFSEVIIDLWQVYGRRRVSLIQKNGKYIINKGAFQKILEPYEAVWFEYEVEKCITNPDETQWQSLPGGDSMDIKIFKNGECYIDLSLMPPQEKYFYLQHSLENLAKYGSILEK